MKIIKRFNGRYAKGAVYESDALELLSSLEDESAALIFLDPPFNLGKDYKNKKALDKKPILEYGTWLKNICDESTKKLAPGGALFLYHLPTWALRMGAHLEGSLEMRHWIAVSMKNGFARGRRLYPAHYALLYFTKGPPRYFKRPKIALQRCRHCDGYVKDYGGYLPVLKRKGANLSDLWEDLSPVRHASKKTRVQNELPLALLNRVLEIGGRRGQLYVDPFCGGGSGAVAASVRGMHFAVGDVVGAFGHLTASRVERFVGEQRQATSTRGRR